MSPTTETSVDANVVIAHYQQAYAELQTALIIARAQIATLTAELQAHSQPPAHDTEEKP